MCGFSVAIYNKSSNTSARYQNCKAQPGYASITYLIEVLLIFFTLQFILIESRINHLQQKSEVIKRVSEERSDYK
ncbi:hypothetical protein DLD82_14770 [Methanospirillum stamsii]|uniref:Uncharacterized protein n=1 Tax=Methanospirillum stamsii TaxID=1277351 RepID=A0A2V2N2L4_9EURY|nr:hypothetical protein DLD82_14770 [Methanospirillum stamsii]